MRLMAAFQIFFIVTPASAQTSEQTILYMLHGFKGEAVVTGSPTTTSAQITTVPDTKDGVRIDAHQGGKAMVWWEYRYYWLDNCNYALDLTWQSPDGPATHYVARFDFSKVTSLEFEDLDGLPQTVVQGLDWDCFPNDDKVCIAEKAIPGPWKFTTAADKAKAMEALAYFKKEYCTGGAR
jgi:hypothetical protein